MNNYHGLPCIHLYKVSLHWAFESSLTQQANKHLRILPRHITLNKAIHCQCCLVLFDSHNVVRSHSQKNNFPTAIITAADKNSMLVNMLAMKATHKLVHLIVKVINLTKIKIVPCENCFWHNNFPIYGIRNRYRCT